MYMLLRAKIHAGFLEQLDSARLALGGWEPWRKKLNLNDAEMSEYTLQLRRACSSACRSMKADGQDVSENKLIAAMRFVTALEHLRLQQPLLTYSTELAPGVNSSSSRRISRCGR